MDGGNRSVLVTGCSSGIGRATAQLLAGQGFRVFAGVRKVADADAIHELNSTKLQPVILDVLNEDDIDETLALIEAESPEGLYGVVNNAGIGHGGVAELTSPDDLRQLFEVNAIAPLRMIQRCLPMLRRGRGRIVNISSLNGFISTPMVGAYAASKQALEALSDTLRSELKPWRIHLSLVRPGQVRTPIFGKMRSRLAEQRAAIPAELETPYDDLCGRADKFNERGASANTQPEQVARLVLRALTARWPKTHYHVGWDMFGMRLAKVFIPAWIRDRLMARVMGVLQRVPDCPETHAETAGHATPPAPKLRRPTADAELVTTPTTNDA